MYKLQTMNIVGKIGPQPPLSNYDLIILILVPLNTNLGLVTVCILHVYPGSCLWDCIDTILVSLYFLLCFIPPFFFLYLNIY